MILRPPISTRTYTLFPTRRSSDLKDARRAVRSVHPDLREEAVEPPVDAADPRSGGAVGPSAPDHRRGYRRRSVGDRSEEHTSELQSLMRNSYAVHCLKKKTKITKKHRTLET